MSGRDDLLRDALKQVAERAVAPDRMAERALRGAARRRYRSIAGGTVGAVAVVATTIAVPTAVLGHGGHRTVTEAQPLITHSASPPGTISSNTPAELAIVKECMVGSPSIPSPTDGDLNLTGPGTAVSSFRVLATRRDGYGTVVLLGSVAALRTCDLDRSGRASGMDRISHQTANSWQPPLTAPLKGPVQIQENDGNVMQDKYTSLPSSKWTYVTHLAGRASPRVTRLTVTQHNGVTTTAGIDGGFFVWRAIRPETQNLHTEDSLTLRAYDPAGHLLQTLQLPLG